MGDEYLRTEMIEETSILFTSTTYKLARRAVPEYSSKFSKETCTHQQHAVIICLKIRDEEAYEEIV